MFDPETPSTDAWCIFENTTIWPLARPSITYISQSGRDRSSGMPARCPATSDSSRSPPGAGTASRWTCRSMSNSSSSTHTGKSIFPGTNLSLRLNIATPETRLDSSFLKLSKS